MAPKSEHEDFDFEAFGDAHELVPQGMFGCDVCGRPVPEIHDVLSFGFFGEFSHEFLALQHYQSSSSTPDMPIASSATHWSKSSLGVVLTSREHISSLLPSLVKR